MFLVIMATGLYHEQYSQTQPHPLLEPRVYWGHLGYVQAGSGQEGTPNKAAGWLCLIPRKGPPGGLNIGHLWTEEFLLYSSAVLRRFVDLS